MRPNETIRYIGDVKAELHRLKQQPILDTAHDQMKFVLEQLQTKLNTLSQTISECTLC